MLGPAPPEKERMSGAEAILEYPEGGGGQVGAELAEAAGGGQKGPSEPES